MLMRDKLIAHERNVSQHRQYMPEIRDCKWPYS
jgi:phosphoketolase